MIVTFEELQAFLAEQFPQGARYGTLQELGDGWAEGLFAGGHGVAAPRKRPSAR